MVNKRFSLLILSSLLSGCASLPNIGPTGEQIRHGVAEQKGNLDISIVNVDDANSLPSPPPGNQADSLFFADRQPQVDAIGTGDLLSVTIYEAGISLFGATAVLEGGANDPSVKAHTLPPLKVDEKGDIEVPYAGMLHVQGRTNFEVEQIIRQALRGKSGNPQVVVNRAETINNAVIVGGAVNKPGRIVLTTNSERVSDIVALAGGQQGEAKDLALRVTRGGRSIEMRLSDVFRDVDENPQVFPGDRLTLITDPLAYSVLGASGRIDLVPFSRASMSLAEAMAKSGGVDRNAGDPGAIFVFRYVKDPDGVVKPVVYHFNMMYPSGYFLAQKFAMSNNDILYFATAKANQPSRMI